MKYELIDSAVLVSIKLFIMFWEYPSKIEGMQVEKSVFLEILFYRYKIF